MARKANENTPSPLYTKPEIAAQKKSSINRLGRDKDGAYRVNNRIDKEG